MNVISISWSSLKANKLTAFLNILLIAFGTGILTIIILASYQIEQKLNNNSKDIDLVVGAKGSPLQLILSSVFYIDFPTGNIPLEDAEALERNPMVKRAVPLALGDNYGGYRIAGTDSNFVALYDLKLAAGRFWKEDLEATIGANVAKTRHLKVGDKFFGAHGLTSNGDTHKVHAYQVTGILEPHGDVTDNLILTNVASVWIMHQNEAGIQKNPQAIAGLTKAQARPFEGGQKEITSLLIQYRSPMSVIFFPRMVNKSTNMQAASPAMESARLFSLIGVGVDTLQWFAILIMIISAVSVFISLYNSLKERKYDLAVMRTIGASRGKLFFLVLLEGVILTFLGAIIGIALGHLSLYLITEYQSSAQARLSGTIFLKEELYIILVGIGIGILASLIPAIQAYRSNISRILSKN
jgi:putative ABC transport system permease protein